METKRCYGCMKEKYSSPVCEHCGHDERRANAPHQLPAGTILQGKYLLGKVLGQGGFGITYLGQDMVLDIPVAIKEYYPTGVVTRESTYSHSVALATGTKDTRFAENRDRFLREARTLARLEDVGEVVQVKNFFEENNTAYIVMGYVQGITLKEHMRRSGGRLSAGEVFRLLEPVLEALGQVHKLGLVHRDISPDNIMLQPNKRARLIDFGAAHAATLPGGTSTQAVLKHGFAPVEQYQSKGHLGSWTDVYAMCATIYHCITGLMPPNATDRMMGEEDFLWNALAGLTEQQIATLKQGLAIQYRERIQTMEELCGRLFAEEKAFPQPRKKEPSVSATGTVSLTGNEQREIPDFQTAPAVQKQMRFVAPVQQQVSFTAPVEWEEHPNVPVKAEHPRSEKRKHGIGKILIAAGILALAGLLVMRFPFGASPTEPYFSDDPGVATRPTSSDAPGAATQPDTPRSTGTRVLMNPSLVYKEVYEDGYSWEEYDEEANYAFGTKALREEVSSITFLDTTEDAPSDAVDASKNQDGSVLAWLVPNGEFYDLYLAADGGIYAPQHSVFLFAYFRNASQIAFDGLLDTSRVTSMELMFLDCNSIKELDVSGFDTSNVTTMRGMFEMCTALKELDLSGFDTGKVESMEIMFNECKSLESLDISGFDTGNVMDMGLMFLECESLQTIDVSGFDTRKVTNMAYMFGDCTSLEELDLSGLYTGNVTEMSGMFSGCSGLKRLDVSRFDTRNVTDMAFMFADCSELEVLDLSGFDTQNVKDMAFMFDCCTSLRDLDVSGFDTRNVTDMDWMFNETDYLTNVNAQFDVQNVKNYYGFMDDRDTFNGKPWEELFR